MLRTKCKTDVRWTSGSVFNQKTRRIKNTQPKRMNNQNIGHIRAPTTFRAFSWIFINSLVHVFVACIIGTSNYIYMTWDDMWRQSYSTIAPLRGLFFIWLSVIFDLVRSISADNPSHVKCLKAFWRVALFFPLLLPLLLFKNSRYNCCFHFVLIWFD